MYRLATKRTEKKRVEENANVSFFRQTIKRAYIAWTGGVTLSFTDFVNFGQSYS